VRGWRRPRQRIIGALPEFEGSVETAVDRFDSDSGATRAGL